MSLPSVVLSLFLLFLASSHAAAITYHVNQATTGGDSNSCSTASAAPDGTCTGGACAKQTINNAILCMEGGDTILVHDGVYNEGIGDNGGLGGRNRPPSGLSPTQQTTFKAVNSRQATLQWPTFIAEFGSILNFDWDDSDYITIEGFVLNGKVGQPPCVRDCDGIWMGIMITGPFMDPPYEHIALGGGIVRFWDLLIDQFSDQGVFPHFTPGQEYINVDIRNISIQPGTGANVCGSCGAFDEIPCVGECHAYYSKGDGGLIQGGTIENIPYGHGYQHYATNTVIRDQTIKNVKRIGIYLIGGSGSTVANNIIVDSGTGINNAGNNVTIVHNTVTRRIPSDADYAAIIDCSTTGTQVKNNLVFDYPIDHFWADPGVFPCGPNVNALITDPTHGGLYAGNVCGKLGEHGCAPFAPEPTTPCYVVNAAGGNYTPCTDSPARDAGVPLGSPYLIDKAGHTRNPPPDAGALEFTTGTPGGAAEAVIFLRNPTTTDAGATITPSVQAMLRDVDWNIVTEGPSYNVTISIQANPGGGTLSCGPATCTKPTVAGVVEWDTLSINNVGTGYTLRIETTGLPVQNVDQSAFFNIVTPPPLSLTPAIKVDQVGYLPAATKIAVLSNPQLGFNATDMYVPGASLTVKTSPGGTTVFTAAPTAWNSGATHGQSGDQLWWFDFSALTTPGTYVINDATNGITSDVFTIGGNVYDTVLNAALRMYYYQRSGIVKASTYAGANWVDGAAFLGAGQDTAARSVLAPGNPATARDVQGGWFDGGDYSKYTVWGAQTVSELLTAYQLAPTLWGDAANIPESGNSLPDIVDEAKWELDWLLRMQAASGSTPPGAVLSKVSVLTTTTTSPPSADTQARYWGAASTTATAASAAAFAQGAIVFAALGQTTPASTLTTAAENAWTWLTANPNVDYPNTGFATANPDAACLAVDSCVYAQLMERLRAAIYLYARTGTGAYKTFVEANYTASHAMASGLWYGAERWTQDALLYYAALPGATPAVRDAIRASAVASIGGAEFVTAWTSALDGYRAYLPDVQYARGSNQTKAATGGLYTNLIAHGLNSAQHPLYRTIAESYLHHLHGVNPLGMAYLSRMGGLGAERSVNELSHGWFADGTEWDNALTSPKGPPPGFLTGGPNASYTGTASPPLGQPIQKSYRDWNSLAAADKAYEISEPTIASQAAYLRLLSQLVPIPTAVPTSLAFFAQPTATLSGSAITPAVTMRVLGAGGVLVSDSTLPITVGLGANPAGGTLACGPATCTKNAVGGIATFDTLSIATVGTGYRLSATTTGGVTAAQSDLFAITPTPASPTNLTVTIFTTGGFLK